MSTSAPTPPQAEDDYADEHGQAIQGHKYDGIREYDNPMPGWWVWIFIISIIFTPFYILGLHSFDVFSTYEERLADSQADLQAIRAAYAENAPSFSTDAAALQEYAADPTMVAAGSETYATICAACHGDAGQGLIGPNLTDQYWINGGSEEDIFTNISEGVPENGMPAWNAALSEEQIAGAMAYVISLAGTNPPGAKEPQGELYSGR